MSQLNRIMPTFLKVFLAEKNLHKVGNPSDNFKCTLNQTSMLLTVKIFVALNVFCCIASAKIPDCPLEKYADQWNSTYFLSAGSAANAAFLNKGEKLEIFNLNPAKSRTNFFAARVIRPFTSNRYTPELASVINWMNDIFTLKIIYRLHEIGKQVQRDTAYNSTISQTEITLQFLDFIMLSFQNNDPVQLVISTLTNAKENLKRARKLCPGNYKGIAMQPPSNVYRSAIKFNNDLEVKNAIKANTDKKFTKQWKGELNLWGNHLGDEYNLIKAGQEIYKDNDTRTIEKLVIPWLLYYTNTYRKENGLDTLKYEACLLKAATYQTDYLFNESKKSLQFKLVHTQNPESEWFKGKSPSDRALTAGCKKYCGENALYNTLPAISPDEFKNKQNLNLKAKTIARNMVYVQWHNSKGHRENMLTTGYTCMGVSVAFGKYSISDTDIDNSGEGAMLKNINWIAFGVQVMAY